MLLQWLLLTYYLLLLLLPTTVLYCGSVRCPARCGDAGVGAQPVDVGDNRSKLPGAGPTGSLCSSPAPEEQKNEGRETALHADLQCFTCHLNWRGLD